MIEKRTKITEWNRKASAEKWQEFRDELTKSESEAWEIMSATELSMTERYKKMGKTIVQSCHKNHREVHF